MVTRHKIIVRENKIDLLVRADHTPLDQFLVFHKNVAGRNVLFISYLLSQK